jgi:hypothetical protein
MDDIIADEIFSSMMTSGRVILTVQNQRLKKTISALKTLGYITNTKIEPLVFIPTDLGRDVLKAEGWIAYHQKKSAADIRAADKAALDLKQVKNSVRYWWIPYVISGLAFLASLVAITIAYKSYKLAESKQSTEQTP